MPTASTTIGALSGNAAMLSTVSQHVGMAAAERRLCGIASALQSQLRTTLATPTDGDASAAATGVRTCTVRTQLAVAYQLCIPTIVDNTHSTHLAAFFHPQANPDCIIF